jgi:curved DNA-binding protein
MNDQPFVDHYEILQLSPNATPDTIERVFRLLAKRYHPDNQLTGDPVKFSAVVEAHRVLSDPDRRARYDLTHDENHGLQFKIFDQASSSDGREEDRRIFDGILSLLYVARRRNPRSGGLGAIQIERMLGVPEQHLEFPMWYLKQHGWIEVLDTGQFAITVQGIDRLGSRELSLPADRLLGTSSIAGTNAPVEENAEPPRLGESTELAG